MGERNAESFSRCLEVQRLSRSLVELLGDGVELLLTDVPQRRSLREVLAERPAQRVSMWVEHGNTITPKLVRHAVAEGLRRGWTPTSPGPEIRFRIEAEEDASLHPEKRARYRREPR